MTYEQWIEKTDFGTVRRYLLSAKFPSAGVLFVRALDLLPELAALMDPTVNGNLSYRQRRFQWLCASGQVRLGMNAPRNPMNVDLEKMDDDALCEVIYLPPLYLVYMAGLQSSSGRSSALMPARNRAVDQAPTLTLLNQLYSV